MFELTNFEQLTYALDRQTFALPLNICGSLVIPRTIDEGELQHAANEVFRLNDSMRMRFVEKDGKVYQEYKPYEAQKFEVLHFGSKEELDAWGEKYATIPLKLDVRSEGAGIPQSTWMMQGASLAMAKNLLEDYAETQALRVKMGLENVPACSEIKLFYLPGGCGAILKMHHIVSDAWTMMLVANQFATIVKGDTPEVYQFDEYIESEKAYRQSNRFERDQAYFEAQYRRLPEATPLWPGEISDLRSRRRTESLDRETTRRIREYAEAHGVSPFIVFLVAVGVYVSRKLERDAFYVGSISLNRAGRRELNTAGPFVSVIPLLVDFDEDETFSSALAKLSNANLTGLRHAKGNGDNNLGELLFDLWVSFQQSTLQADPTVECTQYYVGYSSAATIFTIEDRALDGQYKMHFDYNLERPEQDADELFRVVKAVLREALSDDGMRLADMAR